MPAGAEQLPLLTAAFPQYKPASLLFALRWFHMDVFAAKNALLTSSDTRFWRQFHNCSMGLSSPCGRWNRTPMRKKPVVYKRPVTAPAAGCAPAAAVLQEISVEAFADEVAGELLGSVLDERAPSLDKLTPRTSNQAGDAEKAAVAAAAAKAEGGADTPLHDSPGMRHMQPASASMMARHHRDGLGTALELSNLAAGLVAEGRQTDAIPTLERAKQILDAQLPPDSNYIRITDRRLAAARRLATAS